MLYKFSRAHSIYGATYPRLTYLVNFQDNEYYSVIAKTVEEARKLIETEFEHVTGINGLKLL